MASYSYDYLGRRVSKTVYGSPDVITEYCYDGDQVIAEYQGTGRKGYYVYGEGIDEPVYMYIAGMAGGHYCHLDGLGSVVALSNYNGDVAERYSYDVFGEPNRTSSLGNPYLFTGRQYDNKTGLYYYRARYYHPSVGRFLQTDPIGYKDGLNLYAYVHNNPVNLIDPTGGCSSDIEIPDEISKEVIRKILRRYGRNAVAELQDACRRDKSGCGDMSDCQMCGEWKCLQAIPVTVAAFDKCVRSEYINCAGKAGKDK